VRAIVFLKLIKPKGGEIKMPKYESVVVFDNLLSEEDVKSLQDRIRDIIQKEGGEVTRVDSWGKKRLAFDIKKRREGYYTLFYFTTKEASKALSELDRFCRIEEKVLRHMICHEVPYQYAKNVSVEKPAATPPEVEKEGTEQEKIPGEVKIEPADMAESSESAAAVTLEEGADASEDVSKEPSEPETGN
jgi:small subunit ribosomal protein S6